MPRKLDLTGQFFGNLEVIEPAPKIGKSTAWYCKCHYCNRKDLVIKRTDSLRSGKCKSCGCLHSKILAERNKNNHKDYTGKQFGYLTCIEYKGSLRGHAAWLCKCNYNGCSNAIITDTGSLVAGYIKSCGCLKKSYGETKIEEILKKYNCNYQTEYSFQDLKSENEVLLRFDFAIFNNNKLVYLIEYDGEQHYQLKADKIFSDTLTGRQEKDKKKNQYCLKNNIPLYRIPYWEKNNIHSLEDIVQNKFLVKEREER